MSTRLNRLHDLFTEGKVVVLGTGEKQVVLWVAKPTGMDRQEALNDGRAARARRVIKFDDSEDEQRIVIAAMRRRSREEKVTTLVDNKASDHYLKAMDTIRADKKWEDRMRVIDRGLELIDGIEDPEDRATEVAFYEKIAGERTVEVDRLMHEYDSDYRDELSEVPMEGIDDLYRDAWREQAGREEFLAEQRWTEIWLAIRVCNGVLKGDDWDHSKCNGHLTRYLDHRHEIRQLPDVVIITVREALDEMAMPPGDAAFSAAPTSSSASSEPHDEAAGSPASTPEETSPAQAGT